MFYPDVLTYLLFKAHLLKGRKRRKSDSIKNGKQWRQKASGSAQNKMSNPREQYAVAQSAHSLTQPTLSSN